MSLARLAYQELFDLLDLEDDYGRGVHATDLTGVDLDEAHARYLRTIYELEPLDDRPQALFEQMQQMRSGLWGQHLRLEELIQISPQPLPEREQFLADWIAFLQIVRSRGRIYSSRCGCQSRACPLYLHSWL